MSLRDELRRDADRLEIEVEAHRFLGEDGAAFAKAGRRLYLVLLLALWIPELVELLARALRRGKDGA